MLFKGLEFKKTLNYKKNHKNLKICNSKFIDGSLSLPLLLNVLGNTSLL